MKNTSDDTKTLSPVKKGILIVFGLIVLSSLVKELLSMAIPNEELVSALGTAFMIAAIIGGFFIVFIRLISVYEDRYKVSEDFTKRLQDLGFSPFTADWISYAVRRNGRDVITPEGRKKWFTDDGADDTASVAPYAARKQMADDAMFEKAAEFIRRADIEPIKLQKGRIVLEKNANAAEKTVIRKTITRRTKISSFTKPLDANKKNTGNPFEM